MAAIAGGMAATCIATAAPPPPDGESDALPCRGVIVAIDEISRIMVHLIDEETADDIRLMNRTNRPLRLVKARKQSLVLAPDGAVRALPCNEPTFFEVYDGDWLVFARTLRCGTTLLMCPLPGE
jgi:hypothetical protein